jgi:hypothetical protein
MHKYPVDICREKGDMNSARILKVVQERLEAFIREGLRSEKV